MVIAMEKQASTIATQAALAVLDLAVEMCTRPWIVELSKNSENAFDAILLIQEWLVGVQGSLKSAVNSE